MRPSLLLKTAASLMLSVVVVLAVSNDRNCFFAKKTRSGENCNGRMRPLTESIARFSGGSTSARACTRHWTRARRAAEKVCGCPLREHSEEFHPLPIPKRLHAMFDRIGAKQASYRAGVRWCTRCAKTADIRFKNEPDYVSPEKV